MISFQIPTFVSLGVHNFQLQLPVNVIVIERLNYMIIKIHYDRCLKKTLSKFSKGLKVMLPTGDDLFYLDATKNFVD